MTPVTVLKSQQPVCVRSSSAGAKPRTAQLSSTSSDAQKIVQVHNLHLNMSLLCRSSYRGLCVPCPLLVGREEIGRRPLPRPSAPRSAAQRIPQWSSRRLCLRCCDEKICGSINCARKQDDKTFLGSKMSNAKSSRKVAQDCCTDRSETLQCTNTEKQT